jgi:hypothetical protein
VNHHAMTALWTASCNANLLATTAALAGEDVRYVEARFAEFEKTYYQLVELLREDNKSADVLNSLTNPPLSQTLDEYEDFKYDYGRLREHPGAFAKRRLDVPADLKYKVSRYVYTPADLKELDRKITWQLQIMRDKMVDMVLYGPP